MSNKIVLVSDDLDFFEYIIPRLSLRKSDELFRFNYESFLDKVYLFDTSLIILNSNNDEKRALELIKVLAKNPVIVFNLNESLEYKNKVLKYGACDYITPYTSDDEIKYKVLAALRFSSILEKKSYYRELLVKNNIISKNNEVFIDYKYILEQELERINDKSIPTIIVAISPNEKTKFLLQANQIETCVLNVIRKNDILLNYAPNKYFLLLFNTDIESAQKLWDKIREFIPEKMYAGFANALYKKREQLINEVLNKLHIAINYDKDYVDEDKLTNDNIIGNNFKNYRQAFEKRLENVIVPVFFQVQQNFNSKLFGMKIEQNVTSNSYELSIKDRIAVANFRVSSAGFTKINIDITYENIKGKSDMKRISFNTEEFEAGILEDLLEQFIIEFKKECTNDNA